MGLISGLFNRFNVGLGSGPKPEPQERIVAAGSTTVYTARRLLGSGSALSIARGTGDKFVIDNASGVVTVTSAIQPGSTQQAIIREALGFLALEYPLTITGDGVAPPANAMTYLNEPITFNGEVITYGG